MIRGLRAPVNPCPLIQMTTTSRKKLKSPKLEIGKERNRSVPTKAQEKSRLLMTVNLTRKKCKRERERRGVRENCGHPVATLAVTAMNASKKMVRVAMVKEICVLKRKKKSVDVKERCQPANL